MVARLARCQSDDAAAAMSKVLGLKIVGHDTGAAICVDGKVVAIAEERLTRVKHSFNKFPRLSINYCLDAFSVTPSEIDLVVIDQAGLGGGQALKKTFASETGTLFTNAKVEIINHHDAHAASAFFASPFAEAAILVYDGSGERMLTHLGVYATETETLYRGFGNKLEIIQKTTHARTGQWFPYTFGVGKLYSFLSNDYLGFGPYNQGKMMGLAPYGDLSLLDTIPAERWFRDVKGHVVCNAQFLVPSRPPKSVVSKIICIVTAVTQVAARRFRRTCERVTRFLSHGLYRRPTLFAPIQLPKPARKTDDVLPDQYYASVARAGQHILEQIGILWGNRLRRLTDSKNLCVAGGLGLNIDANRNFVDVVGFENLFVQPGASDAGIPLGCALWGCHMILGEQRAFQMAHAYLGRSYSGKQIMRALETYTEKISYAQTPDVAAKAAQLLSEGAILGWFEGGSEYGPRALGHRSILADARRPDAKNILNARVKHREPWRPFGCSVKKSSVHEYFDLGVDSPFMLLAGRARRGIRDIIPSVVHVDNTSRIQTVTEEINGRFFALIHEFQKITGVPVILNTSFNLAGEPIVETPEDALETFLRSKMDYLVIEDVLIVKKDGA